MKSFPEKIAVIREADCIGCAKCIPVCPTNAIVGAAKHQHAIVASLCIGCGLCLPPCPTDCIDWVEREPLTSSERRHKAQLAKHQIQQRQQRQKLLAERKALKDQAALEQISEKLNTLWNQIHERA